MVKRGITPDSVTYNVLSKGFYKEGKIETVFGLCDHMSVAGPGLDEVTYTSLIDWLPQPSVVGNQE